MTDVSPVAHWAPLAPPPHSPFHPGNAEGYAAWRAERLRRHPPGDLTVAVADARAPTAAERAALGALLARANMAVYTAPPLPNDAEARAAAEAMARALGLVHLDPNMLADDDGLSPIAVATETPRSRYIPYTDRPIRWHTDGYYNTPETLIRGMVLHCVRPAAAGGANRLLDPEIAYIRLRDEDPDALTALMAPDAMTIPESPGEGDGPRPARTGPVFSVDPRHGTVHMRYTARGRNILWKDTPAAQRGVAFLAAYLADPGADAVTLRLEAGWGLVCNNVLHTREPFTDGTPGRLILRGRYTDRCSLSPHPGDVHG